VFSSSEILREHPAVSVGSASAKWEGCSRVQQSTARDEMGKVRDGEEKKKRKEEGRRSEKRIEENFGKFERN
jgi:hypothetical protein